MKKIISLILMLTLLCATMLTSCTLFGSGDNGPVAKIIDVKLTDEEYAFVCKKGNTDLVNSFNTFLAEIKEGTVLIEVDNNVKIRVSKQALVKDFTENAQ